MDALSLIDFNSPHKDPPAPQATPVAEKPSPGSALSADLFHKKDPLPPAPAVAADWNPTFPDVNGEPAPRAAPEAAGSENWAAFDDAAATPQPSLAAPPQSNGGGWAAFSDAPSSAPLPPALVAPSVVDPFALASGQDLSAQPQAAGKASEDSGTVSWATFSPPVDHKTSHSSSPPSGTPPHSTSSSIDPSSAQASREVLPADLFSEPMLPSHSSPGPHGQNVHHPSQIYGAAPSTGHPHYTGAPYAAAPQPYQAGYNMQVSSPGQAGYGAAQGFAGYPGGTPATHLPPHLHQTPNYMHPNNGNTIGYGAPPSMPNPQQQQFQQYQQHQQPQYPQQHQQFQYQQQQQCGQHQQQQQYQQQQYGQHQQHFPVNSALPTPPPPEVPDVFSGLTDLKASLPKGVTNSNNNKAAPDIGGFGGWTAPGGVDNMSMNTAQPSRGGQSQISNAFGMSQQGVHVPQQNLTSTNPFA